MLSRLALLPRTGKQSLQVARTLPRLLTTSNANNADAAVDVPKSKSVWEMYKDKAGVSASPVFGAGLLAYLLSKEILIIHDETLLAAVMGGTIYWMSKKFGGQVGEMLDEYSQNILDSMNEGKHAHIKSLEEAIAQEKSVEDVYSVRNVIYDIISENNDMKLELEYRNNLQNVYQSVKQKLDYQIELQQLKKEMEQEHIVNWLEESVIKSITPQQEKDALTQCIKDINTLALARA